MCRVVTRARNRTGLPPSFRTGCLAVAAATTRTVPAYGGARATVGWAAAASVPHGPTAGVTARIAGPAGHGGNAGAPPNTVSQRTRTRASVERLRLRRPLRGTRPQSERPAPLSSIHQYGGETVWQDVPRPQVPARPAGRAGTALVRQACRFRPGVRLSASAPVIAPPSRNGRPAAIGRAGGKFPGCRPPSSADESGGAAPAVSVRQSVRDSIIRLHLPRRRSAPRPAPPGGSGPPPPGPLPG